MMHLRLPVALALLQAAILRSSAQTVLPTGSVLGIFLQPGASYVAPAGGCLATVWVSGGGGGGIGNSSGGAGAAFPVTFWADPSTPLTALVGDGGSFLGGGGASALLAGGSVLAVAGGGGGGGGALAGRSSNTSGGNAGAPRSFAFAGAGAGGGNAGAAFGAPGTPAAAVLERACFTCLIVRPLRAKHCAVTDRCYA